MDDKKERELISTSLNKNYFVEASAGSGKTTSLVARMVALVESGVPVSKICTITFTKAAADEFFVRFQKLLSKRCVLKENATEEEKKKAEYCRNALRDIDLCYLGTIDAFLAMVAHEMPNEIGVPSDSEVIEGDIRSAALKEEYFKMLSDKNHPLHKDVFNFHRFIKNPFVVFANGVNEIADNRNLVYEYDKNVLNPDEKYFGNALTDFLDIAKDFSEENFTGFKSGNKADAERAALLDNIKQTYLRIKSKPIVKNIHLLISLLDSFYKIQDKKLPQYITSSAAKVYNFYMVDVGKSAVFNDATLVVFNNLNKKIEEYLYALYFHVVIKAEKIISAKLKKEGKFTFGDFLYYVREAFKKSAATDRHLVDHIYERHSYFLLDENQDTNPMQTELFFYITGTEKSDDWREVKPREGSLFIVGDPKQSIYGFRGANVLAYLNTKQIFAKNNEVLVLTRNFRSNVALKDFFNSTMNNILDNGNAESLKHLDIPIDKEERSLNIKGSCDPDFLLDGEYKYLTTRGDDPNNVAKFIYQFVHDTRYQIIVRNEDEEDKDIYPLKYRSINYSDFLIVPRATKVEDYINAFNTYHIPSMVEAMIPFNYSESLLNLVDLVTLMKKPYDKASLYLVLSGDIYHLSQLDINELKNDGYEFDITKEVTLTSNPHYKVINELHELYLATRGHNLSSTLMYLLNNASLELLKKVDSGYLEYTYFVIEKIKEKETSGAISNIDEFNDYIKCLLEPYNAKNESRVLRFKNVINRVKIANLHKVKGLEAPIVILVNPYKGIDSVYTYTDYKSNPPRRCISSVTYRDSFGNTHELFSTSKYDSSEMARWVDAEEAEIDRLEYVAATRAKSMLLVAEPTDLDVKKYYNPWRKLVRYIDNSRMLDVFEDFDIDDPTISKAEYDNVSLSSESLQPTYKYSSPSLKRVASISSNNDEMKEVKIDDAALIGTLIHKAMECIVSSNNSYDDIDALSSSITSNYLDGDKYKELVSKVIHKMRSGRYHQINSSLNDDLLATLSKAVEIYCEMPFTYLRNDDEIVTGTIDLLYVDEEGNYHIIDYKTGANNNIAQLERNYRHQLDEYIKALEADGIKADAHIYHIDVE